jgi:hypothetical protein
MTRPYRALGLCAALGALAVAALAAAQDSKSPPAAPAAGAAPVVTTQPITPVAKALAGASTPDEAVPPIAAEAGAKHADTVVPPPAEPRKPDEPMKRERYPSAVLQAVDKITAETLRFESKVGEPVRYKGLIVTVRSCESSAPDEPAPDNIAYLDVQSQPLSAPGHAAAPPRQVFRGWMFASSPGLHPFEHPIYDLWLIACKAAAPVAEAPIAPKSPAPAKAAAKRS